MPYRLQRMMALIMVMSLLGVLLAACGGNNGGGTGASPAATTGGTGGTGGTGASPAATTGGTGGTGASPAATTGGTGASPAATTGGTGASPAATGGASGGTAPACPDAAQGAQITFWNGFSGPDGKFMQNLVDRFNKENQSGVQVRMTIQPFNEYYNKMNAAASSNTLPDIVIIHIERIATQAVRNVIRPMPDDVLKTIGVTEADFPAAVWQGGEFRGQRYSIPLDIHPLVMYYNKQLLEGAGLNAAPKNREEFERAAQGMTKDGKMGWSVTTGFPIHAMFQTLLHQFGGSTFNEDGTQATWNSEAGVRALQYLKDAQGKYAKPNLPVDAGVTAFKQGNSGIEWNGIWQISNLVTPHEFGAAAPIPQIGDKPAVWAGSHQLALAKQQTDDPKKTAAAGCFIGWLSANSAEWAKGGQIPARNSVREGAEFKAIEPQATIAPSAEAAFFMPQVPGLPDTLNPGPLEQVVIDVMTGKQTDIKKALDDSVTKANQILEQNRQRYAGGQ